MTRAFAGRALLLFAAAALSSNCVSPGPVSGTPPMGPVSDEALGLSGPERAAAVLVQRSHYQNVLDAYGPLSLPGVDWNDPAKSARCEIMLSLPTTGYQAGSFIEGLPVRRAQPAVFNQFQRQLVEGVNRCGGSQGMAFTARTWTELERTALDLLLRNSGTTYCLKNEDCYGVELDDSCRPGPTLRVFGSNTTDPVFFIAFRKFLPAFLSMTAQMVNGARGQLGARHPDGAYTPVPGRCPMKHWTERPLDAVCVRHSCRAP